MMVEAAWQIYGCSSRPSMRRAVPSVPGRPVSEYGRLCHGDGGHAGGHRCRRAFMLTILRASRITATVDGRTVSFIGREALLQNKEASGRPKDAADVALLRKPRRADES